MYYIHTIALDRHSEITMLFPANVKIMCALHLNVKRLGILKILNMGNIWIHYRYPDGIYWTVFFPSRFIIAVWILAYCRVWQFDAEFPCVVFFGLMYGKVIFFRIRKIKATLLNVVDVARLNFARKKVAKYVLNDGKCTFFATSVMA